MQHRRWIQLAIQQFFPKLAGLQICVLGLTYKPATNTLRRSQSVEVCKWAHENGAIVRAFDPSFVATPSEIQGIVDVKPTANEALKEADVIVVATSWPEFKTIDFSSSLRKSVAVIDPNGFLQERFETDANYSYLKIGKRK
jgi:UDPglucose 6-dehydrogenase